MSDRDIERFTTAMSAVSWLAVVSTATIHAVGVFSGWWAYDNTITYTAVFVAIAANIIATIMTIHL